MNKPSTLMLTLSLTFIGSHAAAFDAAGQRYVEQLLQGSPTSIRQAAQGIYNSNYRDQEVLDIAAEVLLQNYRSANDNTSADAMAWLCKALGRSGEGRYKPVLQDVVSNTNNRKMDRHCQAATRNLQDNGREYRAGSINLDAYRQHSNTVSYAPEPEYRQPASQAYQGQYQNSPQQAPQNTHGRGNNFNDIRNGMSMDEVNALIGMPTNTFSHQTGKAWIPFNFRGKDIARVIALYRGQGRIVYSQEHMYNAPWKVLEVQPNPNESGYP